MANKRLVVLISGNGTNLQAVIDACASKYLSCDVVGVVSSKSDAYGIQRARRAHILLKLFVLAILMALGMNMTVDYLQPLKTIDQTLLYVLVLCVY